MASNSANNSICNVIAKMAGNFAVLEIAAISIIAIIIIIR